jgi:hypothetical protein
MPPRTPVALDLATARRIWLHAQRLDTRAPFGSGPEATLAAIDHLGYVQIDTIHVIERCHHHILFTRIPDYRRDDLTHVQSQAKTVFEYWTHALAYVPTSAFHHYVATMRAHRRDPWSWFGNVKPADARRVLRLIRRDGPLSIRDIDDGELVEKDHEWASRKPSKRALQLAFFNGQLTVSARLGMLKTYDLTERHFGWDRMPPAARERETVDYLVDRALRAQGVVSVDSICYLLRDRKPAVRRALAQRVRRGELVPVRLDGNPRGEYCAQAVTLDEPREATDLVHLLSPFDPLVIQRDRCERIFGYRHVFEAYVPKTRRRFGYFALPVLVGDRVAAAIDLKTDREQRRLLLQQWTWIGKRRAGDKALIEQELHRFERFQLGATGNRAE